MNTNSDNPNKTTINKELLEQEERKIEQAQKQQKKLNRLAQLYLNAKKTGIYAYLTEIDSNSLFFYIIIFIVVYILLSFLNINFKNVISIITSLFIVYYLNERRKLTNFSDMQELELKLYRIFPKPKFFYLDAGIIELISSIQEFRKYNSDSYDKLIQTIDIFLKIKLDIENNIIYPNENIQISKRLKIQALNYLHSIIFMCPPVNAIEIKLKKALNSLHFILNHHINEMYNISIKNNNDKSNYYKDYNEPSGIDYTKKLFGNSNFNYYY